MRTKTRILITGNSGFLGSRLALYFKDKYDLYYRHIEN